MRIHLHAALITRAPALITTILTSAAVHLAEAGPSGYALSFVGRGQMASPRRLYFASEDTEMAKLANGFTAMSWARLHTVDPLSHCPHCWLASRPRRLSALGVAWGRLRSPAPHHEPGRLLGRPHEPWWALPTWTVEHCVYSRSWVKFNDLTPSRTQGNMEMNHATDGTFFSGTGGVHGALRPLARICRARSACRRHEPLRHHL